MIPKVNYHFKQMTLFDEQFEQEAIERIRKFARIAEKMGFDFVGCELDKEYFEKGCERFNRECKGEFKANNGKTIKQLSLF